jgi:flagellin-like protein
MVSNKKGISNIVSTLLIVLLVIVAVGVVWVAVRGMLDRSTAELDISQKCMATNVYATKVNCTSGTCDVTVKRGTGGDEFDGVRIILTNADEESFTSDVEGSINELATSTETGIVTGLGNVTKVEVAAYFLDSSGEKQVCSVNSGAFTGVSNA